MIKYSKVNKRYKYIFTNIDIFSKYAWNFPIKSKKISDIKPCFEKIFKERKPKHIWSDEESSYPNHKFICNLYRVQSMDSNQCGRYCILFIRSNVKNENDYNNFLLQFEKNDFLKNDI